MCPNLQGHLGKMGFLKDRADKRALEEAEGEVDEELEAEILRAEEALEEEDDDEEGGEGGGGEVGGVEIGEAEFAT